MFTAGSRHDSGAHTNGIAPRDATPSSGDAQHEQEETRRFRCLNRVRNAARHPDNRAGHGPDGRVANREVEGAFENEHKRIEWRGVLREFLAGVKGEKREVAASCSRQDAAGDATLGRRDEGLDRKRLRGWHRRGFCSHRSFYSWPGNSFIIRVTDLFTSFRSES